jgi:hypothetical protein
VNVASGGPSSEAEVRQQAQSLCRSSELDLGLIRFGSSSQGGFKDGMGNVLSGLEIDNRLIGIEAHSKPLLLRRTDFEKVAEMS